MMKSIVWSVIIGCLYNNICSGTVKPLEHSHADTTIVIDTALPDVSFPLTVKKNIPTVAMRRIFPAGMKKQYLLTDSANSILTSFGVSIWISKNDLETADGSILDGAVMIEIIELSKSHDFIYAKAPTMSKGALLQIDHAFYMQATCKNKILNIKKGKSVIVQTPVKTGKFFFGDTLKNGNINWLPSSDNNSIVLNKLGVVAYGNFYANKQNRIDQYLKLDLGDEYLLPDAASVYLIFKKQTIIASAVSTEVPVLYSCRNMPIGEDVFALAVVTINGKLYVGKTDSFTVTDEDIPSIQLNETTDEQLNEMLSNL